MGASDQSTEVSAASSARRRYARQTAPSFAPAIRVRGESGIPAPPSAPPGAVAAAGDRAVALMIAAAGGCRAGGSYDDTGGHEPFRIYSAFEPQGNRLRS
jgi:hypothetical protein